VKAQLNPYQHLALEYARFAREGKSYPIGVFQPLQSPPIPADAPKVLIFSPHPDDEVIIGGLALRLLREARWNVINVAVTQGSKRERQAQRFEELQRCCQCIGFDLVQTAPGGLERVNPQTREQDPAFWSNSVNVIAKLLREEKPKAVLFPHDQDWNSTHVGTHFLVMDALQRMPASFGCFLVETEFWGQMATPNLMVELSAGHVGDLMTALTFHVGEIQRNPYHLTVPAWMIDNVRRGSELVSGQGHAAPDFVFGTLYRLRRWANGRIETHFHGGRHLSCEQHPAGLFDTED
jgi:N-acetylglucosamine malate deacetylase 1